jgi:hypothetical protein
MPEHLSVKPEEIQRLRELEAKATPAPWYWLPAVLDAAEEGTLASLESKAGKTVCDFGSRHSFAHAPGDEPSPEDQELIAATRNLLPSLLVEREALIGFLKAETAWHNHSRECYECKTFGDSPCDEGVRLLKVVHETRDGALKATGLEGGKPDRD